jgi:ornithine--oxo-acid transaminase
MADGMPEAHRMCELALDQGLLMKDAHEVTLRIAPPLVLEDRELEWGLDRLVRAFEVGEREGRA